MGRGDIAFCSMRGAMFGETLKGVSWNCSKRFNRHVKLKER
ncbi:hypothetical protein roselon_01737 [Roseibacterium elongatum DSM 19469]|uniref:Uncharacterized protein n=1 Tax=Roseicyclus elongatus DSM 19469 TaxID=1294273 RepID=W8RSF0_9RHOB|nr:hypothetical protein roselon_01737 [Roseibacterium elongatum DSM 19469]